MLTPDLSTPLQVLHKLERDMHRAFHHRNFVHKADHFYNFCITALSLKDAMIHHLGLLDGAKKNERYDEWAEVPCLRAATEIANTAKHFVLRDAPKTKSVRRSRGRIINVLISADGEFKDVSEVVPDLTIVLSDGSEIDLYEFSRDVIEYWKKFLSAEGIEYSPQDESTFFGDDDPSESTG